MHGVFGPWMHKIGPIGRLDIGELTVLGLDPNRPGVLSSGLLPADQLAELGRILNSDELAGRSIALTIHYPVLSPKGAVYDGVNHGLRNAQDLIELIRTARTPPTLMMHGHIHRGYRGDIAGLHGHTQIFNCGSSGYGHAPNKRRVAAMCVYDVAEGEIRGVERYLHTGDGFEPEVGGAYASGL